MNYEMFKAKLLEEFKNYLPKEFENYEVKSFKVNKINVVLDSLTLMPKNNKSCAMSPSFYIDYIYQDYLTDKSFERVVKAMAENMVKLFNEKPINDINSIFDNYESKIIFEVINYEMNKALLENVPHRNILDLAVIYRLVVNNTADYLQSTIINQQLSERLKLEEEKLYELAMKNTKAMLGIKVKPLEDIISELIPFDEKQQEPMMVVITNNRGLNGATVILYEEVWDKVKDYLGDKFYVLPSSVHECICVKAVNNAEELKQMVREINREQVEIEERLSDNIYLYENGSLAVV